jgi:hypothetical protein
MHRKQFQDCFNQSFERVPVRSRSTNEFSFADAYFQRLDYKAFAEREQCVLAPKKTQINNKKKANFHESKSILRSLHWLG